MKPLIHGGWCAAPIAVLIIAFGISERAFAQRCCPDAGADTWAFHNFGTDRLRWDTFEEAFRLNREHALDTIIAWPLFYAFRDTLAEGNCFGMSLLAEEIYQSRGLRTPFSGDLREGIGDAYPPRFVGTRELPTDDPLRLDINTRHWQQLSVEFLRHTLDSVLRSPSANAEQIYQDTRSSSYQAGMLSISNHWDGHTMTVFSCTKSGQRGQPPVYDLLLYDSNRPYSGRAGGQRYPHLQPMRISGDQWSFTMADGRVWSHEDGVLTYVPWNETRAWFKIPTNIIDVFIIVFGEGTRVEQVLDSQNRKLFRRSNPQSMADLDTSPRGLGRNILPIVPLTQQRVKIRPSSSRTIDRVATERLPEIHQALSNRLGGSVEKARAAYFGNNVQLQNLKLQTSVTAANQSAAVTVLQNGKLWQVRGEPGVAVDVEIRSMANLADGIRVRQRGGTGTRATIAFADFKASQNALAVQRVQSVPLQADFVDIRLGSDGALRFNTAANLGTLTLNRESIDAQGNVKSVSVRQIKAGPSTPSVIKPRQVKPRQIAPPVNEIKPRIRIRPPVKKKD
ncbi:hypothetical protein [Stieleria mannarensis]|uniref:hypothetical protein n=1 Tax=Stieleria mannarensis TaxID=2755585 RepID=UPI001602FD9D|nr:hypothetical protein [Rhodopirellula sp. JC639]